MDVSEFVRGISLFRRLRPDSLHRIIEHSTVKDFSDGDVVVPYGRQGEILGVILEGRAEVVSGEPAGEVLATLGAGEYFGEMSLLTGEPTSANVQSAGASRVLLIPQETFSLELARNPEAIQELARTLTERLSRRENDEAEQDAVERARRSTRKTRSMRPVPWWPNTASLCSIWAVPHSSTILSILLGQMPCFGASWSGLASPNRNIDPGAAQVRTWMWSQHRTMPPP